MNSKISLKHMPAADRLEFHRNGLALMPGADDPSPGVAYLTAEKGRDKLQRYCTCELSRRKTCGHILEIVKCFRAIGGFGTLEDLNLQLAGSLWFRLAEVLTASANIPLHRVRWGRAAAPGDPGDGGGNKALALFSDKNELLLQYFSAGVDHGRLMERVGVGLDVEGGIPDRSAVIRSIAMITLTPNERMLLENGARSRRQIFEESVWCRFAYHAFREFDPVDCSFRPMVEESAGTFFIVCSNSAGEVFRLACPRKAVSKILSVFRENLPNQHGMVIHPIPLRSVFRVTMDTELDMEVRPVIEMVQQEGERRFYEAGDLEKFRYGRLVYVRELGILAELENPDGQERVFKAPRAMVLRESRVPAFIQEQGGDLNGPGFAADGKASSLKVFDRWDKVFISPEVLERDWCWLSVSYGFGASEVSLSELLKARGEGHRYVAVKDGWVDAMSPHLDFFAPLLENLDDRARTARISRRDFFRMTATGAPVHIEGDTEAASALRSAAGFTPMRTLPALRGLRSSLRDYQRRGVEWLRFLYENALGGLLCDDMGLGKTHQAMGFMLALRELEKLKGPFLAVCPTTVVSHWRKKVAEHAPSLNPVVYHGTGRDLDEAATDGNLVITTYGILRRDFPNLSARRFALVVLDEIQQLKNPDTIAYGCAAGLDAEMVVGLTGTPIENGLVELKALLDLVVPGYLGSTAKFTETFVSHLEKEPEGGRGRALRKLIAPVVLRRKKDTILDELPEKIEDLRGCTLSEDQVKLYQDAISMRGRPLLSSLRNAAAPVPFMHVFALLNILKQICDHPALLDGGPAAYERYESGKWELFKDLLSESLASGQKVVVFSQYLGMIGIMERHLAGQGIGYVTLTGKSTNRGEILERFETEPDCRVFLGSLKAGGTGIDLVAASVVIHYDRWWNAAREDQATDRVHRIGQRRGVQVFKLITEGTLEEKIAALIDRKKTLMERVIVENDPAFLSSLSREELIDLISFQ